MEHFWRYGYGSCLSVEADNTISIVFKPTFVGEGPCDSGRHEEFLLLL